MGITRILLRRSLGTLRKCPGFIVLAEVTADRCEADIRRGNFRITGIQRGFGTLHGAAPVRFRFRGPAFLLHESGKLSEGHHQFGMEFPKSSLIGGHRSLLALDRPPFVSKASQGRGKIVQTHRDPGWRRDR